MSDKKYIYIMKSMKKGQVLIKRQRWNQLMSMKKMISMNERTSMTENNDKHEWNDKYGEANPQIHWQLSLKKLCAFFLVYNSTTFLSAVFVWGFKFTKKAI